MNGQLVWVWFNEDIDKNHKEDLHKHAIERGLVMSHDGFVEGELITEIDDRNYRGHWKITKND